MESGPGNAVIGCAVKGAWSTAGLPRPGTGSLHPVAIGAAGNETAEASGAEGRKGDSASVQAVT